MADLDFLKSLASLSGPQQGAPSLLVANNAPLPQMPPKVVPSEDDQEDADTDSEVNGNEALASKLASGDQPAPSAGPVQGPPAPPTAAAAQAAPQVPGASVGGLSLGDLKAALDKYQQQKQTAARIGAIGDLLANRASAGAIYLGRDLPKNDVSGALQNALPNPFQNKMALLSAYAQMRKAQGVILPQELIKLNDDRAAKGLKPITGADVVNGTANYDFDPNSPKGQEIEANRIKNQSYNTRANVAVDSQAAGAGNDIHNDTVIKPLVGSAQNLQRALSILNGKEPVTTKQLNTASMDYSNAVAQGGAATEGKINLELPSNFETQLNELKQQAGYNADLRKTPAGRALINLLTGNIQTVNGDIDQAMSARAKALDLTTDTAYAHNANARQSRHKAASLYQSGNWRKMLLSQPGPEQGGQQYSDDVMNYAQTHGITPEQAQSIKMQRTATQTAGQ